MRILHCCLAGPFTDDYGYQDNILSKMHKLQGHDVYILTSTEIWENGVALGYTTPRSYFTKEGIPITRVPYIKWLPHFVLRKLRIYKGILRYLENVKPDIIFIHDAQFLSILTIVWFIKKYGSTKIYVDCHADFVNSARNCISKNILHKVIYKYCFQKIEPYTRKFYGTLPLRVNFLKDVYNIPEHKTELLLMGVDDTLVDKSKKDDIRKDVRKKYNIFFNDFLIVTGGKIGREKNIHSLINAFNGLNVSNTKLLIFGSIIDDVKCEIEEMLLQSKDIIFVGWQSSTEIYNILLASDLAVFPGRHSVLWEQAVGLGLPCVFKKWDGHQHVDVGGNCLFVDEDSVITLKEVLSNIVNNQDLYNAMKHVALEKGTQMFSYYEIAKHAIEQ